MNTLFIIQLITSFFVGGVYIIILLTLAERAPKRVAGIILMFPSTIALSFFFLAWVLSPEAIIHAAPVAILSTAINFIFFLGYPYAGNFFTQKTESKLLQILLSLASCLIPWFIVVSIIAKHKPTNLIFTLFILGITILISHFILNKNQVDKAIAISYTTTQKIGRAIFAGLVIATVVFLGKTLGTFWGGIFSAFPAAASSSFILIHWYYGPSNLFPTIQRLPIGTLVIPVFALSAMFFFPLVGFIIGTFISLIISFVASFLLFKIR
ncbi:MAG TPA: hypothetical protein VGO63_01250 [Candidatus Paceibacterota bacterium]|jgi:hypothetical protein|nr:hypothetical protein [Candidatus Paceibacterota bacterium]